MLGTGDVVPADARLLNVDELSIDESSLTGESYPVRKVSPDMSAESPAIHEMKNVAFMGTYVKGGEGIGVVTATGKDTYLGKTALDVDCAYGYGVDVLESFGYNACGVDVPKYSRP